VNVIKFSPVISRVSVTLRTNVSETRYVSIIKVDVRSDENSPLLTSVSLVVLFLLARCAGGGWSQFERSTIPLQFQYSAA
jgi:hypothetical protein